MQHAIKQKTRLQHSATAFFVVLLINHRVVARKAAKRVFLYLNTDKNDAGIVCSKELPMGRLAATFNNRRR